MTDDALGFLGARSRSAGDILAGRLRLTLGGREFVLPVLPIAAEEGWKAALETSLASTFATIDAAGDMATIVGALEGLGVDPFLDALYGYDATGKLPPRDELRATVIAADVIRSVFEVWSATSPLVAIGALMMPRPTDEPPTNG